MPSASCSPCATVQRRLDALATKPGENSGLNIRLSQRAIQPPQHLVKALVELPHVQAARAKIAPSPKSAVLEDDNHNRALILSVLDDDRLQAYVLDDIDFAKHIPFVTACADHRGCAFDRRPITGGLGLVVAIPGRIVTDPLFKRMRFDVLIADKAPRIPAPFLFGVAGLIREQIIIAGDTWDLQDPNRLWRQEYPEPLAEPSHTTSAP